MRLREELHKNMLDLAEAVRFHDFNPPVLGSKLYFVADLSEYTQTTPEALKYLAQKTNGYCDFVNVGLTCLDKEQAAALIDWGATLCFVNLERLDVEIAAILAEGTNILVFENLEGISPTVARELANLNSILDISLDSISLDVANELIKHPHELRLAIRKPPSAQLLTALSRHAGCRLHVTWERQAESAPCPFAPMNAKKVFIIPSYQEEVGKWFENVYIGDADFYPDELVTNDGIIELL